MTPQQIINRKQISTSSFEILDYLGISRQHIDQFQIFYTPTMDMIRENSLFFLSSFDLELLNKLRDKYHEVLFIVPMAKTEHPLHNVIMVDNPKFELANIINRFKIVDHSLSSQRIHPTAIISPYAEIDPSVTIGPYCIINKCTICEGSVIESRVTIYDHVYIGKNVHIHSSCEIGEDDFGPLIHDDGSLTMFPQVGSLIIEDDVEVFPFVAIGKGALGPTIVKSGCKIDHCCQIGHNTMIGPNTIVTANCVVAGSTVIGSDCWVGINSAVREHITIGNHVTIGMGSVVTKSFGDSLTIAGNPANILSETSRKNKIINEMVANYSLKSR